MLISLSIYMPLELCVNPSIMFYLQCLIWILHTIIWCILLA